MPRRITTPRLSLENAPAIFDREHVKVRGARWPCRVFVIRRADLAPAVRAWLSCTAPVDWRLNKRKRTAQKARSWVSWGAACPSSASWACTRRMCWQPRRPWLGLWTRRHAGANPAAWRRTRADCTPRTGSRGRGGCGHPRTAGSSSGSCARKAHGSELRLLKQAQAAAAREAYLEPWTDLSNRQPMPPGWTWLVTSTRSPPAFPR